MDRYFNTVQCSTVQFYSWIEEGRVLGAFLGVSHCSQIND